MAIDYEQAKVLLNNSYEKAAQELPAAVTQYITDNKDALDTIRSCFQSRSLVPKVLIWRLSAGMLLSLKIQGMDCAIRKALTLCCH